MRQSSLEPKIQSPQNDECSAISSILTQLGYHSVVVNPKCEEVNTIFLHPQGDNRPFVRIEMLGLKLIALLDSGTNRNILGKGSERIVASLNLSYAPSDLTLITAEGHPVQVLGEVEVPVLFNGVTKLVSFVVAPSLKRQCYLGMSFWDQFGIYPYLRESFIEMIDDSDELPDRELLLTPEEQQELDDVKQLFLVPEPGNIGCTQLLSHTIEIRDEFREQPPIRKNPYPWSPEVQRRIHTALDNMIRDDIVERSRSDWSQPVIPVAKRDSEAVRLCLDARKLNERTKRDAYPLPHQTRILSRLGSFKYLTTIDLSQAFLQIPLSPASRQYTAFSIPGRGLYQFKRLPFGLANSPATLSKLMDRVLGFGELEPNIFVYLDDIVVASKTFKEHIAHLKELAKRLRLANLRINITKSKFCVHEVPYLGYILSRDGLRPNPDRVQAIVAYEVPKSVRALRRFLGMVNYYRRFIDQFSALTVPLTNLLKNKPKKVDWTPEAEQAFRAIKEKLISAPVMANPDFNLPFTVQTDASDHAIAGVLTQVQHGQEKVIAYHSEKLKGAELNYHAAEKEGLAALRCIEKFRCYLEGTQFTLVTDSSALTFIMRSKWRTSSRLSRWSIELQQYDMVLKHRKGRENIVPDALSRSIEVSELVLNDGWYARLLASVKNDPENHIDFKVEGNNLYKLVSSQSDVLDYAFDWKLCVPESKRADILIKEHDNAFHIGFEKTIDKIKKRYYWPRMSADVKRYVSNCETCKLIKPSTTSVVPEMGNQRVTTRPFQILTMDYIQSLPRSSRGNAHLLVLMDVFSKYCLLAPVRKISSSSLCEILEQQWFRRLSVPQYLISDNATTFHSKEFQNLLAKYEVRHWASARHRSQANPTERLNRTINAMMRSYVRENQKLWDTRISEVEFILNNTVHATTKFTPFKVIFGHEIVTKGSEHRFENECLSEEERMERMKSISKSVFETVTSNLKKAHESTKQRYDLRHKRYSPSFDIGQRVYKRTFRQSVAGDHFNAKLGEVYEPCIVLAKKGSCSYEVTDLNGKSLGVFSAGDLKA